MFTNWMKCKTSQSSRQEGFAYPWSWYFFCFVFCLYTAFKGLLNIPLDYVSVFGDIFRRQHVYNPNSYPKLALSTQIRSRDRHFKYEQKMFVPNTYAAYFLYLLIPSNMETTFMLRSQIQTINVSKAICTYLWKFHTQLSWHWSQPFRSVITKLPCPQTAILTGVLKTRVA